MSTVAQVWVESNLPAKSRTAPREELPGFDSLSPNARSAELRTDNRGNHHNLQHALFEVGADCDGASTSITRTEILRASSAVSSASSCSRSSEAVAG